MARLKETLLDGNLRVTGDIVANSIAAKNYNVVESDNNIIALADYVDSIVEQKVEEQLLQKIQEDNEKRYYIGRIIMNTSGTNPTDYLGFGTWEQYGSGKVLVGINTNDTDFNTVGKTGGQKTVTLTTDQLPAHSHPFVGSEHSHEIGSHTHTYSKASTTSGSTTLDVTQIPSHTHTFTGTKHSHSMGDHSHTYYRASATSGGTKLTAAQLPAHTHSYDKSATSTETNNNNTGSTALSTAQIPAHTHGQAAPSGTAYFRRYGTSGTGTNIAGLSVSGNFTYSSGLWSGSHALINSGGTSVTTGYRDALTFTATHTHSSVGEGKGHTHSLGNHGHSITLTSTNTGSAYTIETNQESHTHSISTYSSDTGSASGTSGETTAGGTNSSTGEGKGHTHSITLTSTNTGGASGNTESATTTGSVGETGQGSAHNNLQPYVVVYFWRRIA